MSWYLCHFTEPSIKSWLPPEGAPVPPVFLWGGMFLKEVSRPPPQRPSIFMLASAARTQPGWACEAFTGLREGKLPAGFFHVAIPPKY